MSAPGTTPGPWRFILNDEEVVAGAYGENVIVDAPLGDTPEQAIANANLIAAAPCLYEALSATVAWLEDNMCGGDLREQGRTALARARGEAQ